MHEELARERGETQLNKTLSNGDKMMANESVQASRQTAVRIETILKTAEDVEGIY
ncbi:hypothetical protein AGMMS49990_07100 [Endomicrobiia bacterium]|nr:hypothetical protein AGMMS49990_07100 [Endomicrobiia bacterium]